jgi:ABC-type antimicrobial peptide transport system permease subunit
VLRESMSLILAGAATGIPAAMVSSRLIASMLFAVLPADAVTVFTAACIIGSVAIGGAYLPAIRASRIEPCIALRHE